MRAILGLSAGHSSRLKTSLERRLHGSRPAARGYGLAVGLFALIWLALCSPWLSGRVTIPYDAKAHFQAQIQFLANAIHSGQSPFWSPFTFAGSPQIADPQSLIFSPAALLALLDAHPSFWVMDTYAFGLLALAGVAVIGYFRDRGWHPAGALVAAVALAFGASASWRVQHIGQIKSFALVWVALFVLSRALHRRSIGYGLASGFVTGVMLAEPDQVALLGAYILAGYIVSFWLGQPDRWRAVRETLPCLAGAGAVGAAIVVVPLALTMLFVAESNRPEIAFSEAVRGSLHPVSLLTMLVGDLFGAFDPKVDYWGPFSESWDPNELTLAQNMSQLYFGVLPFLLILLYGLKRGYAFAREARMFALASAAMLVYAVGRHTPLYHVLYDYLPGVKLFRRPADATFLVGGLLAILGGYLVHRVVTDAPRRSGLRELASDLAWPLLGLGGSLAIAVWMHHVADAARPILLAACWIGLSLATITLLPRLARVAPRLALVVPAALLAADLAANNGPNESTALPPSGYAMLEQDGSNETVRALKSLTRQRDGSPRRDRVELAGLGFEWPNAAMVHGIDHVLGYNPLRLDLVTQAVGAGDTIAGPDQRNFTPLFPSYRSRLADLLGLRFIATPIPVEEVDHAIRPGDLRLLTRTPDAYIYENPRALPRVLFVPRAESADFAAIIRTGRWPAFDPAETVLLEGAAVPAGQSVLRTVGLGDRRVVRLTSYENTRVEIDVESTAGGYVVLNDVWHPWWEAEVSGKPAEILKANVLFRAVAVPAGQHKVVFEFHPLAGAIEEIAGKVRHASPQRTAALGPPRTAGLAVKP